MEFVYRLCDTYFPFQTFMEYESEDIPIIMHSKQAIIAALELLGIDSVTVKVTSYIKNIKYEVTMTRDELFDMDIASEDLDLLRAKLSEYN